jgi:hypothetical protein
MIWFIWWLEALLPAEVRKSAVWRGLTEPRGTAELLLVILIAFIVALLVSGRRVVVQ